MEGLLAFSNHDELDRFNQEARQANRHPELFALYPPADEVGQREGWYTLAVICQSMSIWLYGKCVG